MNVGKPEGSRRKLCHRDFSGVVQSPEKYRNCRNHLVLSLPVAPQEDQADGGPHQNHKPILRLKSLDNGNTEKQDEDRRVLS